jgi:(1->4)-alpha-D-glucan 1-alpha-D-glucosylmutase
MSSDHAMPSSTYRLQLRSDFGFRDATALVPYLERLGISHVYCSPYLRARTGSPHGYDITDHGALNPELGDEQDFADFVAALRRHGLGQILDFVPNHMGVAQADNAWWLDVLEHGQASPWSGFFDIDWQPTKAELRGKVLAPFLGDHYGAVLEGGELRLAFDSGGGTLSVWYHDHRFPVSPRTTARLFRSRLETLPVAEGAPERRALETLLRALESTEPSGTSARRRAEGREQARAAQRELATLLAREDVLRRWFTATADAVNGEPNRPESWRLLHRLLEAQHYRLAYWRVAADEINYRRFFNVNELAGLRMERREVFDATHGRVLGWIADGTLAGLRIDHIDGLYDPKAYCERLRDAVGERPLYLVVEKILAHHESLRGDWPVDGTTGYEFLGVVGGLFVDPVGEPVLRRCWRRYAPEAPDFDAEVYACKKLVMNFLLGGELQVLAHALDRLSEAHWDTRDFTETTLREALKEVIACFPVYRSYVDAGGSSAEDRRDLDWALAQARNRSADPEPSLFDWIHRVLGADPAHPGIAERPHREILRFVMRFQQLTGAVTAKAVEDTAFYRQHLLVSINEVGDDPHRFGSSPAAYHRANAERLRRWPHSMLATATHDTKRGEDTRLRIHVLSELAEEWERRIERWSHWNRRYKQTVANEPAPASEDEYFLYQILLGSWPHPDGTPPTTETVWLSQWRERLEGYLLKALREAKRRSSWRHPNPEYEEAQRGFLRALLDAQRPNPFLADMASLAARAAALAAVHGLAQTALKIAAPGVPDTYQGCELWDLSLADPDNRRPVDFAARARALHALESDLAGEPAGETLDALLDAWPDGRIKLFVTARLLGLRRRHPELLLGGEYLPLEVCGQHADRVVALQRSLGDRRLIVVAPRLVAPLLPEGTGLRIPATAWGDTAVRMPADARPCAWRDLFTGRPHRGPADGASPLLPVADCLAPLPVAAIFSVPSETAGTARDDAST